MKNKYIIGAAMLLIGLLIAFGPQSIFSVCEFNPEKAMKCHWMAKAEMGVGLIIAAEGALSMLFEDKAKRFGLYLSALLIAIVVMALPHVLIGVCKNAHMPCAAMTRPALTVLGIGALGAGGLGMYFSSK